MIFGDQIDLNWDSFSNPASASNKPAPWASEPNNSKASSWPASKKRRNAMRPNYMSFAIRCVKILCLTRNNLSGCSFPIPRLQEFRPEELREQAPQSRALRMEAMKNFRRAKPNRSTLALLAKYPHYLEKIFQLPPEPYASWCARGQDVRLLPILINLAIDSKDITGNSLSSFKP